MRNKVFTAASILAATLAMQSSINSGHSLLLLLSLAAAAMTNAQNVTVTAANASNDAIYDVTFSGGGGTFQPDRQGTWPSLHRDLARHRGRQLDPAADQGGIESGGPRPAG